MKITSIELYKLFIPLHEPFIISLGPIHSAENVLVRIFTDQDIIGFGECSPFSTINGETADTGMIVGQYFAKGLLHRDPLQIEENISVMNKIIYGNQSIKSAFDMALYDIASQHAGQPLYQYLGGDIQKKISTDYTVSIGEPDKMAGDALKIKEQGYPAIKVKLGNNGQKDILRIQAIRQTVGMEIPLRIDANQGWSVEEAIQTLNGLSVYNIQHCEEPIPRWAFMELPRVRKESPIPLMSDESCGDDHDAARLISLQACDLMNIKLGKSGGIFTALKMVKLAESASIHLQVGAFMESRLAMTAFAHFSLCSPLITHFDFDTCLMFAEDPVTDGIQYGANGSITVPEKPGLGASIGDAWLRKLEKVVIQ